MSEDNFNHPTLFQTKEFLSELLEEITDPIHTRIIKAYQGDDPVNSMENELGMVLLEVLAHED